MARIVATDHLSKAHREPELLRFGEGGKLALAPIAAFIFSKGVLSFAFAMSSKAKPPGSELNFEKAMSRLEGIVEQMESGKLPLEDLIIRYEEGMNLVKVCQERLTSAEQKIEIIARNSAGKAIVKDFETAAKQPNDEATVDKELKNDEVRLF
jgi:exodeoxyribonuclease VII small subunit